MWGRRYRSCFGVRHKLCTVIRVIRTRDLAKELTSNKRLTSHHFMTILFTIGLWTTSDFETMGLKVLTRSGINVMRITGSNVNMRKLLEMWRKQAVRRRRVVGAASGKWMQTQLSKMNNLNQKVISGSLGR